jgi:selenocysteine-specific elongation factor
VVGTAGHIDHGKSALVKALTGTDPDRLEEEKRRGMTIDLGFAHLDLPSGRRVGIVDVPGHERLIRNMLAGATGIDLVLLVVAADEGVMPQTREHLDILRFLRLERGIVVLNKVDLVADPEWLSLVAEDVRALVAGTFLEDAPVIRVSARTGAGLADLVQAIDGALDQASSRPVDAPARMPVDRSFTMAGFGTVVTGTLWAGRIQTGDTLELLPEGREIRVRHVQSHGVSVTEAVAGQRAALNVVGATKEDIQRGHVLAAPGSQRPTDLLDVRLRLLAGAPPLGHHERVRVYIAADEVIGRVRLLDRSRLAPGEAAVAQLRLERPGVAARGDAFILRRYSPMVTIGGGDVIAPHATLRRRGAAAAHALASEAASGLEDRLRAALVSAGSGGATVDVLAQEVGVSRERAAAQVRAWVVAGQAVDLRGRVFAGEASRRIEGGVLRALAAYHDAMPWRRGMPREELKTQVFGSGDDRLYGYALDALASRGEVALGDGFARLAGFTPRRSPLELAAGEKLEQAFRRGRYAPPSREDGLAAVTDRAVAQRMLQALLDEGVLIGVGDDITFHRDVLEDIRQRVLAHIATHGEITVAALRDELGSSRKYALTVLEHFDATRLTRRVGDKRVLARPAPR